MFKKIIAIIVLCIFAGAFAFFFLNKTPAGEKISDRPQIVSSNQWYSSLYLEKSFPLYAMPLAFQVTEKGLGFSYPKIKAVEKTIFAPYEEDFSVGFTENIVNTEVVSAHDWSVKFKSETGNGKYLSAVIGHGIPFTVISASQPLQIKISLPYTISYSSKNSGSFVILVNNHYYYFYFSGVPIKFENSASVIKTDSRRIFAALLPNDKTYQPFAKIARDEVMETETSFDIIGDKKLAVNFSLKTKNNQNSLIALYPHQYDRLIGKFEEVGKYETLRGKLKLIKTKKFTYSLPLVIPPNAYPRLSQPPQELLDQAEKDIAELIAAGPPESADYFLGAWLGRAANLALISDRLSLRLAKKKLINFVEPILIKSVQEFEYDPQKFSLIAKKPEFGNEKLNDHHFHYGYFIRAAAVFSQMKPEIKDKIEAKINLMAADIASPKNNRQFPPHRNFDHFEGHSWADGAAGFFDGNNQESTSEAINAWYGIYLWSSQTGNAELKKTALYLYNSEILSASYYWFDRNSQIYSPPYKHKIASIVWGGKSDFATWFSPKTNMIYGIQLLPLTPGSLYLKQIPSFAKYERDFLENGGGYEDEWGDLLLVWKSFSKPQEALKLKDKVQKFENNNPRSNFLYFLLLNSQ